MTILTNCLLRFLYLGISIMMNHITKITALIVLSGGICQAKDLRNVSEPVYPAVCSVLQAGPGISTDAIQNALNDCAPGKAVKLQKSASSAVFLSGPLSLPSGTNLWIDSGASLKAVNNATAFDKTKNSCGVLDQSGKGCNALITVSDATNSGIYGKGVIDGQGGVPLEDKKTSWWQLAAMAKNSGLKQNAPRLIQITNSTDFTIYDITLLNAPHFHVVFDTGNGLTVWNTTINSPRDAINTDGIDPISSKNVTIAHSNISTGDDNVAIKAYSHKGPAQNISVIHNTFEFGHGMSIGSETNGIYGVLVDDLTLNGTENGLRIKSDRSDAGEVDGVTYKNVTMTNVRNPVVIDTVYENKSGSQTADWKNISYQDITSTGSGVVTLNGQNARQKIIVKMTHVELDPATKYNVNNVQIDK
ncbi:glycoside hydrolase family 28 protein [Erwinia amylovora]|uniref:glycoside hydrolase family 28 protein n=1 Tax=Erwinia amylovora TaxID=552 RepID=UPI000C0881C5|nr:glycosyl hydrolase family 28 protein [Erwinia amylovora]